MLKELLFPAFCLNCNKFGSYICKDCRLKLDYLKNDICLYCEKESFLGKTHFSCREKNGVDGLLSVFHYTPTMKHIIGNIKYKLVKDAFRDLFNLIPQDILQKIILTLGPNCVIQPVPLHPNREKLRGFNQSEIISLFLSKQLNYKVVHYIERVKETDTQAQLNKEQRKENIVQAFSIKKGINLVEKSLLLVDDVVTTGSTVKEVAKVLKTAGIASICVFSVAKG